MNPKLLFCLALVLGGGWAGFRATAQDVPFALTNIPTFLPVTNVNFSVTHPISLRVPTKLKIERTVDMLSVALDPDGFESTNLMVGTNAVTVVLGNLFVWPVGGPGPTNWVRGYQFGLDFNLGADRLHVKPDGLPRPGKSYIVEMDLAAYETDAPAGHMLVFPWSTNRELIWQRTLKQTVK